MIYIYNQQLYLTRVNPQSNKMGCHLEKNTQICILAIHEDGNGPMDFHPPREKGITCAMDKSHGVALSCWESKRSEYPLVN